MIHVTVKDRITGEITNAAKFITMDGAVEWSLGEESNRRPWGRYQKGRDVPKRGLGYSDEVSYNDALVEGEFEKEVTPGVFQTWVRLHPEYIVDVEDKTAEYAAEQEEIDSKKELRRLAKEHLKANKASVPTMNVPQLNEMVVKILDFLEL